MDANGVPTGFPASIMTSHEAVTSQPTAILTHKTLRYVYLVIGSLGVVGNSLVVGVMLTYRGARRQFFNTYIINQCLVDTVVGLFLILTSVFEDDGRHFSEDDAADAAFCKIWLTKVWLWGFLVSSTYNLLALALERYLAVVHPIWHKMKFDRTKVYVSIAFVWLFGPAYNLAYMVPTSGRTGRGECTVFTQWPDEISQRAVGVLTIGVQFVFPLTLMIVCYIRILLVLRRRVWRDNATATAGPPRTDTMARTRRNVIKTLVLVTCAFVVCWTWNQVYFLMFNLGYGGVDFTSNFYHFTVIMVFCNCCLNPFIYIAKYEQFQRRVRMLFCRRCVTDVGDLSMSTSD